MVRELLTTLRFQHSHEGSAVLKEAFLPHHVATISSALIGRLSERLTARTLEGAHVGAVLDSDALWSTARRLRRRCAPSRRRDVSQTADRCLCRRRLNSCALEHLCDRVYNRRRRRSKDCRRWQRGKALWAISRGFGICFRTRASFGNSSSHLSFTALHRAVLCQISVEARVRSAKPFVFILITFSHHIKCLLFASSNFRVESGQENDAPELGDSADCPPEFSDSIPEFGEQLFHLKRVLIC